MSRHICLALDLVDDGALIAEYECWHTPGNVPPAVIQSIRDTGIENMEIFRAGDRMFMIMGASGEYDASTKARANAANAAVVEWTKRTKQYQKPVPAAGHDGTWIEMNRVFRLVDHSGLKDCRS